MPDTVTHTNQVQQGLQQGYTQKQTLWRKSTWLLSLIQAGLQIGGLWCLAELLFALLMSQTHGYLLHWFLAWAACFLLECYCAQQTIRSQTKQSQHVHQTWRSALIATMLNTTETNTAHLFASAYIDDIEKTSDYIASYMPHFANMVALFVSVGLLLLFIEPLLSLVLFAFFVLLGVGAMAVGMKVKQVQRAQSHTLSTLNEYFVTILQGLHLIRYYGAEAHFDQVISHHARAFQRLTMRLLYFAFVTVGFVEMLQGALIGSSIMLIGLDSFTHAQSLFAVLLIVGALQPMRLVLEKFHSKSAAKNALARIETHYPQWQAQHIQSTQTNTPSALAWETITIERLAYKNATHTVFDGVNWSLTKGSYWHLQGANGTGKSTLLSGIAGLVTPTSGIMKRVQGGESFPLVQQQKRMLCAFVEQMPSLLPMSIGDIVRMGNHNASNEAVRAVLEQMDLYNWVQQLPDKLNTRLTSDNRMLSGGQTVRLALARALLAQRDILLLDEWHVALDAKSRSLAEQAITQLHHAGATIIEVSHLPVPQATNICTLTPHGCICE